MLTLLPLNQSPSVSLPEDEENSAPRIHWIWLIVGCAAAIGIFALGAVSQSRSTRPAVAGPIEDDGSTPATSPITVHVAGKVTKPGVYEFSFDARVRDAIRKAGGPAKDADLNSVNLAAYLEDAQKIELLPRRSTPPAPTAAQPQPEYSAPAPQTETLSALPDFTAPEPKAVPRRESTSPPPQIQPKKEKISPEVPRASTARGEESQNADPKYFEKNPLNLNKATAGQLELLPGIGPAMAAKILTARKEKGGFKSVEDLDEVPGIGEKTMEKLRPLVTVS